MKKILTSIIALAMVASAHAASINWTVTGSGSAVFNDYVGNPFAGTAYLVLASDLTGITSTTQTVADFTSALSAITLDTVEITNGKKPVLSGKTVTSDLLVAGTPADFGLLIVSEDGDGNGFYKYTRVAGTPYATGATADAQTKVSTAWAMGNVSWNQGYAAQQPDPGPGGDDPTPGVPEPATGALALAGLALLFRRRRA